MSTPPIANPPHVLSRGQSFDPFSLIAQDIHSNLDRMKNTRVPEDPFFNESLPSNDLYLDPIIFKRERDPFEYLRGHSLFHSAVKVADDAISKSEHDHQPIPQHSIVQCGEIARVMGLYSLAIRCFTDVISYNRHKQSGVTMARENGWGISGAYAEFGESREPFYRWRRLFIKNIHLHLTAWGYLSAQKKFSKKQNSFLEKPRTKDRHNSLALSGLGAIFLAQGKVLDAHKQFRKALVTNPSSLSPHWQSEDLPQLE